MTNFEIPAKLYMSSPIHAVRGSAPLEEAQRTMRNHRVSGLAVVGETDRIVGVITRSDLLRVGTREAGSRHLAALLTLPDRRVEEEMTPEPRTVLPDTPLSETAALMVRERLHRIFVVDPSGAPRGVISPRDLMQAIAEKGVRTPIGEWMSSPIFTIRASEPIALATERLEKAGVTGLVVMEAEWPVGVFTQEDALAARDLVRKTAVDEVMNPAILVLAEGTPLHRAAAQAGAMEARRVVVTRDGRPEGILTGIDFARAVM